MNAIGRPGPLLLAAFAVGLTACGDDPPPSPPDPPPAAPAAPAAGGAVAATGAAANPEGAAATPPSADPVRQALLAEIRKRPFRNEDFLESEVNRDPFRSFLSDFSGGQAVTTQYQVLLPKNSLEELRLIAIVGPPARRSQDSEGRGFTQPRAMFLDPSGMGIPVLRGDHISKADAKVTRIDAEKGKVYVEVKEDLGGGKTTRVERVIELHLGEEVGKP